MTNSDFFLLLEENVFLYLMSLFLSVFIIYFIYKHSLKPLIDYFTLALVGVAFANSIPIFLFATNSIQDDYFIYFVISEFLFWISFFIVKRNRKISVHLLFSQNAEWLLFILFYVLVLLFSFVKFYYFGIPLLSDESRLGTFYNSQGFGLISRVLPFLMLYCTVYIYLKFSELNRITYSMLLLCLIICSLLDGAKSALSVYVFAYFFVYNQTRITFKILIVIVLVLFGSALIVQYFVFDNWAIALLSTINRFVAFGDVYYFCYPSGLLDSLQVDNPLRVLFSQMFAPFKIVPYPENFGYTIYNTVYPYADELRGPNCRMPILSYILFHKWGVIFSFIGGLITSWGIFFSPKTIFQKSAVEQFYYLYIYSIFCSSITGYMDFIGFFFDLLFNTFFLLFFICVLKWALLDTRPFLIIKR